MKKLLFVAALMATTLGAMAQGTLTFKNSSPVNAPIFDVDGVTKLVGTTFQAQLYWKAAGAAASTFAVVKDSANTADGAVLPFRDVVSTSPAAGYWNPGADAVRNVGTIGNVDLQVRVWNQVDGATFAVASTKAGAKIGSFDLLAFKPGDSTSSPPATPTDMVGFAGGKLTVVAAVPEPSTIALGLIGAGALLLRRRNK